MDGMTSTYQFPGFEFDPPTILNKYIVNIFYNFEDQNVE